MRLRLGTTRRWLDLGVFALAVGGAIGVWKLASDNRELRAALVAADSRAVEAMVRDRLVGTSVPLSFLALHEPDPGDAHLIWLVDLEDCPSCLAGAHPAWNALGEDASLRRHVVVFEEDEVPEAARRALAARRSRPRPAKDWMRRSDLSSRVRSSSSTAMESCCWQTPEPPPPSATVASRRRSAPCAAPSRPASSAVNVNNHRRMA